MAIDPELLAEAQRRGIPIPKPAPDPELIAEAKRRGIAIPGQAGPAADPPMFRGPQSPVGADAALSAIGRGGSRLNKLIQNAIGAGVSKAAEKFGPVVGNTAAFAAAPTAGLIEAAIPKDKWEAGLAAIPAGDLNPAPLTKPLGAAARGLGSLAEGTVEHASQAISKRTPQAFEMLRQKPDEVLSYARKGMGLNSLTMTPEAVALAEAQGAGRNAQGIIDKSAEGAGKDFGNMMEYLKQDRSKDRFSVAEKVYDKMEPFIENQTSYRSATRSPTIVKDAEVFNPFYERIKATQAEGMSPGEAGDLLQQMTREQQAARGAPLSAHIAELKNALLDALPGEYKFPTVDTPTPSGWGIKETRDAYKSAKTLQRETAPFTNKDNPIAALRSVARAGGDASVSLKNAADKIPALKAALDKMNVASAGAEFAPKMTTPPGTGLTGAAGLLLTKLLGGNVAALPSTALFALGMSPRATAETLVAGRKAGSAIMNAGRAAEPHVPNAIAALLRLAKKKNETP